MPGRCSVFSSIVWKTREARAVKPACNDVYLVFAARVHGAVCGLPEPYNFWHLFVSFVSESLFHLENKGIFKKISETASIPAVSYSPLWHHHIGIWLGSHSGYCERHKSKRSSTTVSKQLQMNGYGLSFLMHSFNVAAAKHTFSIAVSSWSYNNTS